MNHHLINAISAIVGRTDSRKAPQRKSMGEHSNKPSIYETISEHSNNIALVAQKGIWKAAIKPQNAHGTKRCLPVSNISLNSST